MQPRTAAPQAIALTSCLLGLVLASGCAAPGAGLGRRQVTANYEPASETAAASGSEQPLPGTSLEGAGSLPGSSIEDQPEGPTGWERLSPSNVMKSVKNATGLGPDQGLAKQHFADAEAAFKRADYKEAADKYNAAAGRWPDSGLEEDSLFMLAESYYFSDRYPKACDTYDLLVTKYANSRHLDKVVARQFSIARYWQQHHEARPHWFITPNVVDKTRPIFDTAGHAREAFDRVRLNDPRSSLADDAIMAIANGYFLKNRFDEADHYYAQLRKDYPKSEHQVQAHLLGLQCKLRSYQGPDYDGTPLDQAEELVDQTLLQFPTELPGEERERLVNAKKEVHAQKASRDFRLAQYYDKGKNYRAARYLYNSIVKDYPQSSFAEQSQQRLAQIQTQPDEAPKRLAWLDSVLGEDTGTRRR